MWQRITGFLVVFLLMFSGAILGQNALISKQQNPAQSRIISGDFFCRPDLIRICSREFNFTGFKRDSQPKISTIHLLYVNTGVSPVFYANSLGFICKTELKLDKITPVPFRFRLGSLDYVNWLERKPNAIQLR